MSADLRPEADVTEPEPSRCVGICTTHLQVFDKRELTCDNGVVPACVNTRDLANTYLGGAHMADATCSVDGCEKRRRGRFCAMHESRLLKHGTLDPPPRSHAPADERFWRYVQKTDGCWPWTGSINNKGYGQLGISRGNRSRAVYAHRFSYELHVGPIPPGMGLLHSCDNPPCVNPAHLSVGTQRDNMLDAAAKGRTATNERSPNARFSNETIREIRRRVAAGEMQKDVAADIGMSTDYIWKVVRGDRRRGI
jgi:hypothetical protein